MSRPTLLKGANISGAYCKRCDGRYNGSLIHLPWAWFLHSLLFEDHDSGLFSVTLFRKAIDDFRHKARENKYGGVGKSHLYSMCVLPAYRSYSNVSYTGTRTADSNSSNLLLIIVRCLLLHRSEIFVGFLPNLLVRRVCCLQVRSTRFPVQRGGNEGG